MIKKVTINVAGSSEPIREDYVVTPETTAEELLQRANLDGYLLCGSTDELPLGDKEPIYDRVNDGGVVMAYRAATAGFNPPFGLKFTALFHRRGWKSHGKWLKGYYRTRYGAYEGKIRKRFLDVGDFYIRRPPSQLRMHEHWCCFWQMGSGWYRLHFDRKPKSTSDGIKAMEMLLLEALQNG